MSSCALCRASVAVLILLSPIAIETGYGQQPAAAQGNRLAAGALPNADRPFGTLREQAAMQQAWLKKRLDTFLPPLMRKYGIDM